MRFEDLSGSVIAMVGKDCVAIASDLRLGNQALLVASNFEKVRSKGGGGGRCEESWLASDGGDPEGNLATESS